MTIQNIFTLGVGNVGAELIKQVKKSDSVELGIHDNPTRIVGIANSQLFFFDPAGIKFNEAMTPEAFLQTHGQVYNTNEEFIPLIQKHGLEGDVIFIDATASKEILPFHLKVITETKNKIVTANKNPLALCSLSDFKQLTLNRKRYGAQATVMGGAHVVEISQQFYDTCEGLKKIEGSLSGTLAYISAGLERGENFSTLVKTAYQRGYMEPNPLDDLNGLDVARKLLIIGRSLNLQVSLSDINIRPFIDTQKYHYDPNDLESLFKELENEDSYFQEFVTEAHKNNTALRYVARLDLTQSKPELSVGLIALPLNSPIGILKGTANKVVIESENFPEGSEYIVQAPGAGSAITASGIRRDLLQMLPQRVCGSYSVYNPCQRGV